MRVQSEALATRARLAWTVLLASFTIFISLCLALPFSVNIILQSTTKPLSTSVSTNQGTVAVAQSGSTIALLPEEVPREVEEGAEILTNAADSALLLAYAPENQNMLARVQVYGNTNVKIDEASTPRFQISSAERRMALTMKSGRLGLTLLPQRGRQFSLNIQTPQGKISLHEAGQYSIDVQNEATQINVQSGRAQLTSLEEELLLLEAEERGVLSPEGGPQGPFDAERNLVKNGDFRADLSGWIGRPWNLEFESQPAGETRVVDTAGEKAVRFSRVGIGHADTEIRQILNQDVTDFESLRLLINFRIMQQSLGVCGQVGSECPLTVRLEYQDENGVRRVWQQGFYANGQIDPNNTPDICTSCTPPNTRHVRVVPNRLVTQDIDLLENLAYYGAPPPRYLENVQIIAAGHQLETEVLDITLLAKE